MTIKILKSANAQTVECTCFTCGCVFSFQRSDTFFSSDRFWRTELVRCPECEQEISVQHLTPWRK